MITHIWKVNNSTDTLFVNSSENHQQKYVCGCIIPAGYFTTEAEKDELMALFWNSTKE